MKVIYITEGQAQELTGVEFIDGVKFNPIKDTNGEWFLSTQEQQQCSIEWLKEIEPQLLHRYSMPQVMARVTEVAVMVEQINQLPTEEMELMQKWFDDNSEALNLFQSSGSSAFVDALKLAEPTTEMQEVIIDQCISVFEPLCYA